MHRARTATPSRLGDSPRRIPPPVDNEDDDLSDVGFIEGYVSHEYFIRHSQFTRSLLRNSTQVTNEQVTPLKDRISQLRVSVSDGLMRTPSGTYISRISKQPTPEPSEVDQHSDVDQQTTVDLDDMDFGGMDDFIAPQEDSIDVDAQRDADEVEALRRQLEAAVLERESLATKFETEVRGHSLWFMVFANPLRGSMN